jgi:ribosomal protein L11 methyltransferase
MKYRAFVFVPYDDLLLANLSMIGFDSFQEEGSELLGYVEENRLEEDIVDYMTQYCIGRNIEWKEIKVEEKNWNQIWESSFEPVYVDDFCLIKASFHKLKSNTTYVINIDPKMAFGTGHHHTTYMMIQAMQMLDFANKSVLDYGSGTGVLAILAEMMGARIIDALDIEENSFENIQENCSVNQCEKINPILGTIDDVDGKYDIILANINRNVLLETADLVRDRLSEKGVLVLSGILSGDLDLITDKYRKLGFVKEKLYQKSNWAAIYFTLSCL